MSLGERFPFLWSELLDRSTSTDPTLAARTARRVTDGAFGEMRSVGVDTYTTQPSSAAFQLDDAAAFTNLAEEWRERIASVREANQALARQRDMAVEVQQGLTVQLMHGLRKRMAVDPKATEREAGLPLWRVCEERLAARATAEARTGAEA